MRPIAIILLLGFLWVPSLLQAQTAFEGIVVSRNTTTDELGALQQYTMTLRVKGDMVRTEISAFGSNPASVLIYRRDLGVVWILDEGRKTYFEMRTGGRDAAGEGKQLPAHPQIKKTGRSKKVLGYSCDQLILRSEGAETEYWGTKKLTALAAAIARAFDSDGSEAGGMSDALAALGYFPMISRTKLEGRVIESSEVTKIQRCALEESLFAVPADYRKESAPDMP
jgi:hypothetical protein